MSADMKAQHHLSRTLALMKILEHIQASVVISNLSRSTTVSTMLTTTRFIFLRKKMQIL